MMKMKPGGRPQVIQNRQYLAISEVAKVLGVSTRSVYSYIKSGKLPGERIGQTLVVRRDALEHLQRRAAGRPRTRTPIWRVPIETNQQYLLTISVCLREGQEQRFQDKLVEIRQERRHLLVGTVARYIAQQTNAPEQVRIVLIWRQQLLPSEEERQAALAALRADFWELLNWETAISFEGQVALNA